MKVKLRTRDAINILWGLLLLVLLVSCRKEKKEPLQTTTQCELSASFLSEEEAMHQAKELYSILFGNALRSRDVVPEVSNVLTPQTLRTAQGDTLFSGLYVVNFQDNKGYIILAESKFSEPVVFATQDGNMYCWDDWRPAPSAYSTWINIGSLLEEDNKYEVVTDLVSIGIDGIPRPREPHYPEIRLKDYEFGEWERIAQVEPLIPVRWDQWKPHNLKLNPIKGTLPPVGCVVTAVSQIMCYHRYPNYDWDRIIEMSKCNATLQSDPYCQEVLSTLHRDLGKPNLLDVSYSINGSGAYSDYVPRTFRAYNYKCGDLIEYDWKKIKNEVSDQRPVYVRAKSIRYKKSESSVNSSKDESVTRIEVGHAWVLDGIVELQRKVTVRDRITQKVLDTFFQKKKLVHCNYGWGGTSNGYYLSKVFDTQKGAEIPTGEKRKGYCPNYEFGHDIISGITR